LITFCYKSITNPCKKCHHFYHFWWLFSCLKWPGNYLKITLETRTYPQVLRCPVDNSPYNIQITFNLINAYVLQNIHVFWNKVVGCGTKWVVLFILIKKIFDRGRKRLHPRKQLHLYVVHCCQWRLLRHSIAFAFWHTFSCIRHQGVFLHH
jgi:hypothetical protein